MWDHEHEYVVVGSGAGGGPVASNLARAGHTVLVLEAGGPAAADEYEYSVPAFHTLASEKDGMSWRFFVRHYASDERQKRDGKFCPESGGVFYPRAGTLGGCTAHNAMIFVCPSNGDWTAIAEDTGDESWRPERMRRYFERIEDCRYRPLPRLMKRALGWNPSRHGYEGWLPTSKVNPKLAIHDRLLRWVVTLSAWRAFFGLPHHIERVRSFLRTYFDPNDWRAVCRGFEGIRLTPLSTLRGRRVGTRDLLLETQGLHPDKLTIKTGALATRVVFDDDNRALGVEYLEGAHLYRADPLSEDGHRGVLRRARATREVILAGGTFNTPQLLQLSGIGPAELLRRHGIPVRVDLPGVGANLQDRYEVSVVNRMKRRFRLLEGAVMRPPRAEEQPDPFLRQWIDRGAGIYTSNGAVMSILRKSSPAKREPDLLIFGLITNFRGYFPGYSAVVSSAHQYLTWTILKGYSHNTSGTVTIRSADPRDVPEINFRYFDEGNDTTGEDLEAVAGAVEFVRKMTASYPKRFLDEEEVPGARVRTREEIRQFIKDEAWGHHASGTCRIGRREDPMAVLDSAFRVHGTTGLRVVDASVFPRIPGLFIVSSVYMVAEKASDVILHDGAAPRVGKQ
jgi:choline dehydrogenase